MMELLIHADTVHSFYLLVNKKENNEQKTSSRV